MMKPSEGEAEDSMACCSQERESEEPNKMLSQLKEKFETQWKAKSNEGNVKNSMLFWSQGEGKLTTEPNVKASKRQVKNSMKCWRKGKGKWKPNWKEFEKFVAKKSESWNLNKKKL